MAQEFTTIKVSRSLKRRLHGFKARMMLRKRKRISDAEAILEAIQLSEGKKLSGPEERTPTVWEMAGFIKGGKRFNAAKELDKVVYGV